MRLRLLQFVLLGMLTSLLYGEDATTRRALGPNAVAALPFTLQEAKYFMLKFALFFSVMFLIMSAESSSAQTPMQPITDPKLISSKNKLEVQKLSIEKLYMTRSVGGATWSPDGKQVAFITNISGRNNLWTIPADGGWPTQLTVSDQRQAHPTWSADGKWIALMSDYDGDEQWDIFLVSPQDGTVFNLTNTREISETSPTWSPDGKRLAYEYKPKTSSSTEIHVMDVLTRHVEKVTENTAPGLSNYGPIWSRDGKRVLYTQSNATGKDLNVFLAEFVGESVKKTVNLTPHTGEHSYNASALSPDGKLVLITSNAKNGYDNVGLIDVVTKQIHWLTEDKWEIHAGEFTPDGKWVTWNANIDGATNIFFHELTGGKTSSLPLPIGVNGAAGSDSAFTRDGGRMLYYHNGPTSPNDLWIYSLADGKSHQLTHSLMGGIRTEDMVEPFLVHFPSKDSKFTLSALLYVPHSAPKSGQHAGIVYVHGGPAAQTENSFNRIVQYMANQGYFVIAPNYRGSTGYGKEFEDANIRDFGGQDMEDVVAAADFLKATGFVDPKKIALMGGSYGGYLTMVGVTKHPEMWAAGVPIVPFVNWFTEIENEDPLLQEYDKVMMGDPAKEADRALLHERSPIFFVDKIKAPLLILAGGNDPRCPKSESQQVLDAIKKNNGVAELKIYGNEGHGFARVENQIDAYKRVADFLKAHVPPAPCGCNLNEQ